MLNLNSVMLNSEDYQKLANFYGEVLQRKPDMEDKEHSVIGYVAGSCFIMICAHDKVHGSNQNPERMIVFFETEKVQDEFNRIKTLAGASVVKEPYSPSGEADASIATLADPDGNYFQLVTPWKSH
jgi:predicted enzyme related to lactoylglutathione lyase